jgi:hypothetical protein
LLDTDDFELSAVHGPRDDGERELYRLSFQLYG